MAKKEQEKNLTACLAWIMEGENLKNYTEELCAIEVITRDIENPEGAFLADAYDMFTLDTTVIASALGQLLDEGRIDAEAKPFVHVAIKRQLHPKVVTSEHRKAILLAVRRVVDAA